MVAITGKDHIIVAAIADRVITTARVDSTSVSPEGITTVTIVTGIVGIALRGIEGTVDGIPDSGFNTPAAID